MCFSLVGSAFRLTSWTWRNGFQPHIPRARRYLIQPLVPVGEKRLRQFVISFFWFFFWKRQNRNPTGGAGFRRERGFCSAVFSAQGSQHEEPVLEGGCGSSQPRTAQELGMLGLENQTTGWGKGSLAAAWPWVGLSLTLQNNSGSVAKSFWAGMQEWETSVVWHTANSPAPRAPRACLLYFSPFLLR